MFMQALELKHEIEKKQKMKQRLEKLIDDQLKGPVKDELITTSGIKGGPPLPLPEALCRVDLSDELVSDAIGVWDFINSFK
jgi:hypothetical protein